MFRKEVSKRIFLLNRDGMIEKTRKVTFSSKIVGYLSQTQHEHEFWMILYIKSHV